MGDWRTRRSRHPEIPATRKPVGTDRCVLPAPRNRAHGIRSGDHRHIRPRRVAKTAVGPLADISPAKRVRQDAHARKPVEIAPKGRGAGIRSRLCRASSPDKSIPCGAAKRSRYFSAPGTDVLPTLPTRSRRFAPFRTLLLDRAVTNATDHARTPRGALAIWCNHTFPAPILADFRRQWPHCHWLPGDPDSIAQADICLGQPDPALVLRHPKPRWIHLTSAGYTRYDHEDIRQRFMTDGRALTNSSGVYAEPCAQHLLAMMLAVSRDLPEAFEAQRATRSWDSRKMRPKLTLLAGQTALLLGFGAIGQRLADMLAPFHMRLFCLRRRSSSRPGVEAITPDDFPRVLPLADHVIDTLPDNAATGRFVNAALIGQMKRGACFYNVGRGATVDQDALLEALRSGQIGAAYLDVATPEPLPPDHALWSAPHCHITPHAAGGHKDEPARLMAHFIANLRAFERNQPLSDFIFGRDGPWTPDPR